MLGFLAGPKEKLPSLKERVNFLTNLSLTPCLICYLAFTWPVLYRFISTPDEYEGVDMKCSKFGWLNNASVRMLQQSSTWYPCHFGHDVAHSLHYSDVSYQVPVSHDPQVSRKIYRYHCPYQRWWHAPDVSLRHIGSHGNGTPKDFYAIHVHDGLDRSWLFIHEQQGLEGNTTWLGPFSYRLLPLLSASTRSSCATYFRLNVSSRRKLWTLGWSDPWQ